MPVIIIVCSVHAKLITLPSKIQIGPVINLFFGQTSFVKTKTNEKGVIVNFYKRIIEKSPFLHGRAWAVIHSSIFENNRSYVTVCQRFRSKFELRNIHVCPSIN